MNLGIQLSKTLAAGAQAAEQRATAFLIQQQRPEGSWWQGQQADARLLADYVLTGLCLSGGPLAATRETGRWASSLHASIQRHSSSTSLRVEADLAYAAKFYFALRASGYASDEPSLGLLREYVLAHGGLSSIPGDALLQLAAYGCYPPAALPALLSEWLLTSRDWAALAPRQQAMLLAGSVCLARRRAIPVFQGIAEELGGVEDASAVSMDKGQLGWFGKLLSRLGGASPSLQPQEALQQAGAWLVERIQHSEGVAGDPQAMLLSVIALERLGYAPEQADRVRAEQQCLSLFGSSLQHDGVLSGFSALLETSIALQALARCRTAPQEVSARGARWIENAQAEGATQAGQHRGWPLGSANPYAVRADATAEAVIAMSVAEPSSTAIVSGTSFLRQSQTTSGGWAAHAIAAQLGQTLVFFGDLGIADSPSPDVTGQALAALSHTAVATDAAGDRGKAFLVQQQQSDGSWKGRWGISYLYGTYMALRGLQAVGESDREAHVLRGGEWMRSIQNADGGWGESAANQNDGVLVAATSNAVQTAWAILGLLAGGDTDSLSVRNGVEYLLATQTPDGDWPDEDYVYAAVPERCLARSGSMATAYPLQALAGYQATQKVLE